MNQTEYLINTLKLARHPEGGYFRETYRSAETIDADHLPSRFVGARSLSTAIYFLLTEYEFSAFHRIRQDEIWHFHSGASMQIECIDEEGTLSTLKLGMDLENGARPQQVIPAGSWFAAHINADAENSHALVTCTLAPGFDFDDLELPSRQKLLAQFPQHRELITHLTRR